ncbi:unnamed protein product [Paramecium octaurelia]|uniref:Uncharacterized protein n=1 Tax=Paramecium octaurelia TaxID=43137 RepID=A0A8S1VRZ7_PAROT|nr:unnamed protein product [Paramecium octaurelia]
MVDGVLVFQILHVDQLIINTSNNGAGFLTSGFQRVDVYVRALDDPDMSIHEQMLQVQVLLRFYK